ncbi:Hsp20/alpha crystallin family protein [Nitzschia inconspicua]|uniref:Hsp20/alpha crystallin family protein n=1 Tax=Nitzschia inconspicua TaxID=303405 RepID=A0A9K3M6H7_9STRA|nr:Hsp20/alpha crystallin family protein [Nitzschia inconspicua]
MSTPQPSNDGSNNEGRESRPTTTTSPSWFKSWFNNQSTDMRKEIREKLNNYEEERKRYEEQMRQQSPFDGFFGNAAPFFSPFGMFGGSGAVDPKQRENDFQDFFQRFQEEMMSSAPSTSMSSTSTRKIFSSGSAVSIRESSLDGAQIDVQLPRGSSHAVSVDVVQEYPCVVQYSIDRSENGGTNKMRGQSQSNQVRLGEYIDCSKISASISKAQGLLTIKAPVQENTASSESKVRVIAVTENDHEN